MRTSRSKIRRMTKTMRLVDKIVAGTLLTAVVALVVVRGCERRSHERELATLRNRIAEQSRTVELERGLYQRKSVELGDLKKMLDSSRDDQAKVSAEIERQKLEIVALNTLVVRWKRAYEGAVDATQHDPPDQPPTIPECAEECAKHRTMVMFGKEFGPIRVTGHTITNPPEGAVKVEQVRPFELTVALVQAHDGSWSTVVGSSDDLEVDLSLSAVDPYVFRRRWYERLSVDGTVALGDGLLATVGFAYDVGNISIGPLYGVVIDGAVGQYLGASVSWRPFER